MHKKVSNESEKVLMQKKIVLIIFLSMSGVLFCSQENNSSQIMSYEEYALTRHTFPYTFIVSKEDQYLFYFGANHSCDPQNMQYPVLKKFWDQFVNQMQAQKKECVVLVEGSLRGGPFVSEEDSIINGGGEGGLITFLANKHMIGIECPEPPEEYLYSKLIEKFSQDEIKYKTFAQQVLQFNRHKKTDPELNFDCFISRYKEDQDYLEKMKLIHVTLFNEPFNPHDEMFFYHITNPVETKTVINHVCRQASTMRDAYIVDYIKKLVRQNKNIFIAYGATHSIMQESALRNAMLGKK